MKEVNYIKRLPILYGVHLLTASEAYRVRSFNFDLTLMLRGFTEVGSPSASSTLARKTDRTVSFSSNSLLFWQSNGFSLERAFAIGIPYLSRTKAKVAQGLYSQSCEVIECSLGPSGHASGTCASIQASPWRKRVVDIHQLPILASSDNGKPSASSSGQNDIHSSTNTKPDLLRVAPVDDEVDQVKVKVVQVLIGMASC
jgi:hypothetical protein